MASNELLEQNIIILNDADDVMFSGVGLVVTIQDDIPFLAIAKDKEGCIFIAQGVGDKWYCFFTMPAYRWWNFFSLIWKFNLLTKLEEIVERKQRREEKNAS